MLAIRLQRLGRKAMPIYRIAVQESQRHPSSGRVVAYIGNYNPHDKNVKLDSEKVAFYLKNGAQPSPRVASLLAREKVELPAWVKLSAADKKRAIRNPEKLRKNQPKDETAPSEPATKTNDAPAEDSAEEPKVEDTAKQTEEDSTKE